MKRRRKRDIIIELTSLLDVIMIMIFMVMAENSKLISEKQTALEYVQTENAEKNSEIEELRTKLDGLSDELVEALGKLDEGSLDELLRRILDAENRLDGYEYMDDVVIVINVGLENKYNNTVRYLSFSNSANPGSSKNVFEIHNESDLNTAINQMKVFVSDYTRRAAYDDTNSTIAYIIFSYNTENVFQDDYAAVDKALNDLEIKANSGNVRYRLNPLNH